MTRRLGLVRGQSRHATAGRIVSSLNSQPVRIWFQSIMMPGRAAAVVAA